MRVEPFLDHLRAAMPSRDALEDYGLDDDEIADIQSAFVAIPRQGSHHDSATHREVERMIVEFDCSMVEIGLIRFEAKLKSHAHGLVFASCEADPLVLREDGTIAMFDHMHPGSNQLECAVDSERFLEALAAFIDIRKHKADWSRRVEDAVELCANAAGGSQYQEFFRVLCGFIRSS